MDTDSNGVEITNDMNCTVEFASELEFSIPLYSSHLDVYYAEGIYGNVLCWILDVDISL